MRPDFEITVKWFVGYIDTEPLLVANDIEALPLTSFKPESRNITSNESIDV